MKYKLGDRLIYVGTSDMYFYKHLKNGEPGCRTWNPFPNYMGKVVQITKVVDDDKIIITRIQEIDGRLCDDGYKSSKDHLEGSSWIPYTENQNEIRLGEVINEQLVILDKIDDLNNKIDELKEEQRSLEELLREEGVS